MKENGKENQEIISCLSLITYFLTFYIEFLFNFAACNPTKPKTKNQKLKTDIR